MKPPTTSVPFGQDLYRWRTKEFLICHPFCQVWLTEHGVSEEQALREKGRIVQADGQILSIPSSSRIFHRLRKNHDPLDEFYWLAVSEFYERQITSEQAWARSRGYLVDA